MKQIFMLLAAMAFSAMAFAQQNFNAIIKDKENKQALIGVTVRISDINKAASTDQNGLVIISGLDSAYHDAEFSYLGYKTLKQQIKTSVDTITIFLEEDEGELDEVIVSSTRSSRTISDIPTRIELIAGEELDEKSNMKPGDIRMLLNESTGIQTQQTSATSANASIRIQGLDGRYTQILKDGFPLYSGAASGLGLLQIPPLDLRQVEVIKGSSSTLYGGGAIAGIVNLISKTPSNEPELKVHLNGTSAGGLDLNGFYSQKFEKTGITLFASRNSNQAYDPSGLDLTAIPEFERYTFNPRLFVYVNKNTKLDLGVNTSFETRTGGDLHFIEGNGDNLHRYFERNKTQRLSSQFTFSHQLSTQSKLLIKNSVSYFNRDLTMPGYQFEGRQIGTYSEVNYSYVNGKTEWITGINHVSDKFNENRLSANVLRDYSQNILGIFAQNNFDASDKISIESGLRGDYVTGYGFVLLPRISALFKFNPKLSSRIGGGFGYKNPTIFTEESERIQYQNVLPVSSQTNKLEKSYGLNVDANYRTGLFNDKVSISLNHMFFYTNLKDPLTLMLQPGGLYKFENIEGHIDTKGMETNVKFIYSDFKLFLGYTLTDTKIHQNNTLTRNPLTAKHRLNNVLMYELEDKWKLGAEAYYFSEQLLNDGLTGEPYWTFGFMAERLWSKFSIYINFENFTDTRQSRFDSIYTGSVSNPVFRDIYAPLDGFVVNGGLKIRL